MRALIHYSRDDGLSVAEAADPGNPEAWAEALDLLRKADELLHHIPDRLWQSSGKSGQGAYLGSVYHLHQLEGALEARQRHAVHLEEAHRVLSRKE